MTGESPYLRPPASSDREATPLRLLVEAPDGLASTELALRRFIQERLGLDARGLDWQVDRLFQPTSVREDDELTRFFEITGAVVASPAYPVHRLAFDLARRLSDTGPFAVDPDLPSSAFGYVVQDPGSPPGLPVEAAEGPRALADTSSRFWALDDIRARAAWALPPRPGGASRGAGILVGHPDTGYSLHPELEVGALDLALDRDVIDNDDDARDPLRKRWWFPLDTPGHGTHTGSVIAGRSIGQITGAAPEARLVPIRTIKSVVQVFDGDVAKAVFHAHQVGCHVISMSLGGIGFIGLQAAIAQAVRSGAIVLGAAGNDVGFVVAPAIYPECVGVGASTADGQPWSRSSHGPAVDICAPGESVWAASVNSDVSPPVFDVRQNHHGTSYGTAHLAGVAALWLAHHGHRTLVDAYGEALQAVFLELVKSVGHRRPTGWDTGQYGAGIVDAERLLTATLPTPGAVPRLQPRWVSPADRFRSVLPELSPDEADQRVAEIAGVGDAEVERWLNRFGRELVYLLTEDRQLRREFLEGAMTAREVSQPRALSLRVASVASRSLADGMRGS
jgi:Subtilase family